MEQKRSDTCEQQCVAHRDAGQNRNEHCRAEHCEQMLKCQDEYPTRSQLASVKDRLFTDLYPVFTHTFSLPVVYVWFFNSNL